MCVCERVCVYAGESVSECVGARTGENRDREIEKDCGRQTHTEREREMREEERWCIRVSESGSGTDRERERD